MTGDDDFLTKSPSAARMGKASELLVAAACILATRGELNASTSLVDDEGVDLVFHRLNHSATLAVQVKARMSDGKGVQRDEFRAVIREQTFRPRVDLDLLFVAVDIVRGAVTRSWLVPSVDFARMITSTDANDRFRFTASMKSGSKDRWTPYRLGPEELAPAILVRLVELEQWTAQ